MKRVLVATALVSIATLTLAVRPARANTPSELALSTPDTTPSAGMATPTAALSIQPMTFIPVGALSNTLAAGVGGFIAVERRLSPSFSVGIRLGYIAGIQQTSEGSVLSTTTNLDQFPMFAGARFYPGGRSAGLYLSADLGAIVTNTSATVTVQAGGVTAGGTSSAGGAYFGGMIGAGYRVDPFDLTIGAMTIDLTQPDASTGVFAMIGYSFFER